MDANRNSLLRMLSHNFHPIDDTHLHQDTSNQGPVEVVEVTVVKEEVVEVTVVKEEEVKAPGAPKHF